MAALISVQCEPCGHNGITTCADTWCNDCEEGFCDECIKGHQLSKFLRDHHRISITDYMQISSLSIDTSCPVHSKKYEFFCPQHDSLLCLNCCQTDHSKCVISGLAEASKGSKHSTALMDLERNIKRVMANLTNALQFEDETLAILYDQEQTIKQKIVEARQNIIAFLDKLQEELLDELKKKFEECVVNVNEQNTKLKQREREMMTLRDNTSSLKKFASEIQTFIGIKDAGKILLDQNKAVRSLFTHLSRPSLDFTIDDNVLAFQLNIRVLGKIEKKVEKTQSLSFIDSLSKQAQIFIPPFCNISQIKLQLKQTFRVHNAGQEMSLTSCVLMPNKETVFVDNVNGRIIMHSANGDYKVDFNVCKKPFDVAVVNSDRIAVTGDGFINLINVDTSEVKQMGDKRIHKLWGIKYHREILYGVKFNRGSQIIMINLQGNIENQIPVNDTQTFNIAVYQDLIYVISLNDHSLHAYEKLGNKIWTFRDKRLCKPRCFSGCYSNSVAVDNCGNVYVTLPDYDSVLLVSSDGQKHRVILDRSNQLIQPSGVSFHKETNQLLVCNRTNGYAAIYSVNG